MNKGTTNKNILWVQRKVNLELDLNNKQKLTQ